MRADFHLKTSKRNEEIKTAAKYDSLYIENKFYLISFVHSIPLMSINFKV